MYIIIGCTEEGIYRGFYSRYGWLGHSKNQGSKLQAVSCSNFSSRPLCCSPLRAACYLLPLCQSFPFLAICLLFRVTFFNQPQVNFFAGRISDLIMLSLELTASGCFLGFFLLWYHCKKIFLKDCVTGDSFGSLWKSDDLGNHKAIFTFLFKTYKIQWLMQLWNVDHVLKITCAPWIAVHRRIILTGCLVSGLNTQSSQW